jgi:hypothetical protein
VNWYNCSLEEKVSLPPRIAIGAEAKFAKVCRSSHIGTAFSGMFICSARRSPYEDAHPSLCPEEDLNLHGLLHTLLRRARLPVSPSGLGVYYNLENLRLGELL